MYPALVRTEAAIYSRVNVTSETPNYLNIHYARQTEKGIKDYNESINKKDIVEIRRYQD